MKHTQAALLLAFTLISLCTKAQDEVLKTNGRSYTVNIMYKDDSIVKFQKYQDLDKRIFAIPLSKIYALKYAGGQTLKPDGSAMSEEMYAYEKIAIFNQRHLKKGIALTSVGCVVAGGGLSLIVYGSNYLKKDPFFHDPLFGFFALFGGTVITAAVLPCIIIGARKVYISKSKLRKAGAKPVTMNFNPMMIPSMNQSGVLTDFAAGAGVSIHF